MSLKLRGRGGQRLRLIKSFVGSLDIVRKLWQSILSKQTDFETFLEQAPQLNPARVLIKGVICGVRIEEIEEETMREIRYLDKLIDELAKGKTMEKILRK